MLILFRHNIYTYIRITVDGLTATPAHHQNLKRQRIKEKSREDARSKPLRAGKYRYSSSRIVFI